MAQWQFLRAKKLYMKNKLTESLDMLLDAMSNAFGSIVLISLLLVISTSHKSAEILKNQIESRMRSIEKLELDKLSSEASELEKQAKSLEVDSSIDTKHTLAEEIEKNKELMERFNELIKKISERFKDLKITELQVEELVASYEQNENIQQELNALYDKKVELEKLLVKIKAMAEPIVLSPPIGKMNNSKFAWVIISNGYFFVVNENHDLIIANGDNSYFVPDYSKGWLIDDANMQDYLNDFPPDCFVCFIVEKNDISYMALRSAIKHVLKRNISYFWAPNPGRGYFVAFARKGWTPNSTY